MQNRYEIRKNAARNLLQSIADANESGKIRHQIAMQKNLKTVFRIAESNHLKSLGITKENGVYAEQSIPKGTVLGVYHGYPITKKNFKTLHKVKDTSFATAPYLLETTASNEMSCVYPTKEDMASAKKLEISPLYFINHIGAKGKNCEIDYRMSGKHSIPVFVTTREVKAGKELLIDYGINFDKFAMHPELYAGQKAVQFKSVAEFARFDEKKTSHTFSNISSKETSASSSPQKKRDIKAMRKGGGVEKVSKSVSSHAM